MFYYKEIAGLPYGGLNFFLSLPSPLCGEGLGVRGNSF